MFDHEVGVQAQAVGLVFPNHLMLDSVLVEQIIASEGQSQVHRS